jgi:hypothetical protein
MLPLIPLADFAAHKQEFLGRLGIHVAKKEPQVGELLPVVARHLTQE